MEHKEASGSTTFLRALESHALWREVQQKQSASAGGRQELRPVRNVLAADSFQQLFFYNAEDKDGRISVINLKRVKSADTTAEASHQTIRCVPAIEFPIRELIFNEKSNLLCAVGHHRCAIIEISDYTRREFSKRDAARSRDAVDCRTFLVGNFFHNTNPGLRVLKAAWHPLSDNHLAILASDNTLRLYDLASDVDEPEQLLPLRALYAEYEDDDDDDEDDGQADFFAIDFTFGTSRLSWDCFTIYFLTEDGEIYGLSPVVPYNALLADSVLTRLKQKVMAHMDDFHQRQQKQHKGSRGQQETESAAQRRYQLQISWLNEVRGQTVLRGGDDNGSDTHAANGGAGGRGKRKDRSVRRADEGWILTRRPSSRYLALPALQGPLEPSVGFEPPKRGQLPVGILSVPSSPTVLVRCFLNGLVDLFIAFDELEPDWPPRPDEDVPESGAVATLTLFERLSLGLPVFADRDVSELSLSEDDGRVALVPAMSLDPVHKDLLYIRHAAGVHVLRLAWLDRLETFALTGGDALPDFPPTEAEALLQTLPTARPEERSNLSPAPLFGFTVVRDPGIPACFIAVTSTWKCVCVRLEDTTTLAAPPAIPLLNPLAPSTTTTTTEAGSPPSTFAAAIRPLLEKKLPRIAPIATRDAQALSYSSPEALQFMVERCQLLRREYVLHIQHLAAEIQNQAKVLGAVQAKQEAQTREVAEAVERLKRDGAALQAKIQRVNEVQEMLTDRSQLVVELITSQRAGLSTAEKQFFRELREKKQALPALRAKIEQLRNQSEELLRLQAQDEGGSPVIHERHLKKLQPILDEEVKMIAETVEGMRKLQLDIENEFPSDH